MRRGLALALLVLSACRAHLPEPRLAALDAVLAAKDDNDPRLDRDFEGLSQAAKKAFRLRYAELPREYRNERGIVVYLLGRNMRTPEDGDFLRRVAGEAPCLSLWDCSQAGGGAGPGDEVTLAYPSLVALKRAEAELARGGPHKEEARTVSEEALASQAPAVRRMAERLAGR
ncbi:MAG: hypothetical protein HYV15_03010 [Elusimicrobia bacterium]|nr:hypothetical protein [Elusimicrobiota bacterium]